MINTNDLLSSDVEKSGMNSRKEIPLGDLEKEKKSLIDLDLAKKKEKVSNEKKVQELKKRLDAGEIMKESLLEKENFRVNSVECNGKEVPVQDRQIIDMPMSTNKGDGIVKVKIAPTEDIWMYETPEKLKGEQLFFPSAFLRETKKMGKKLPFENKEFMKYIKYVVSESQKGNKEPYTQFAKENSIKPCGIRYYTPYQDPFKKDLGSLGKAGEETQILTGNINKKGEVQVIRCSGNDIYLLRESPKFAYSGRCIKNTD